MPIKNYKRVRAHEHMTGDELRQWRAQQPGRYKYARHQWRPGWSQQEAAEWAGVSLRSWSRWELGHWPIPKYIVGRLRDRRASMDEIADRIFDTPRAMVDEMGGVIPELAHEKKGES